MNALKREFRVAFSKRAQPVWFRMTKWVVIVGVAWWLRDSRYFWEVLLGLCAAGLVLHFFYRWKTCGWTRAWGGWNDFSAVADGPAGRR